MRAILAAWVLATLCACSSPEADGPVVFAAASLEGLFDELAPQGRVNLAGSDELATQIREGARADVLAVADVEVATGLFEEGLVERPVGFATNRLVVVTTEGAGLGSLAGLDDEGVRIVVGAEGVPAGDYARAALQSMDELDVLDNVVSRERDVRGVLAKVALGEADAGFVYATDVASAPDRVDVMEIPEHAQPEIVCAVAVVRGSENRAEADALVDRLLGAEGRDLLEAAGFGLP